MTKKKKKNKIHSLQVILAIQAFEEPISKIVENCFDSIHNNALVKVEHGKCKQCQTQNVIPCPTPGTCYGVPCKFHMDDALKPKLCPTGYHQKVSDAIQLLHRGTPFWKNTDASKWCTDSMEIAKCFINPPESSVSQTNDDIDCLSLLHIMRNCKHFDDKLSFDITSTCNPLSKAIQAVEKVQTHLATGIDTNDCHSLIENLRILLMDKTHLYRDFDVRLALQKLSQNNIIVAKYFATAWNSSQNMKPTCFERNRQRMSFSASATVMGNGFSTQLSDEPIYYCQRIDTKDQKSYRYCTRRVKMALSKFSAGDHDKKAMALYEGEICILVSHPDFLRALFPATERFEQTTLSDARISRKRDSPILFIVSSPEETKLRQFFNSNDYIEENGKHVCVLVVGGKHFAKKTEVTETEWGFLQYCTTANEIDSGADDLWERHIFKFYEHILKGYFASKQSSGGQENCDILGEAMALHKKFEIPLPECLHKRRPAFDLDDTKALLKTDTSILESVKLAELKELPHVFDIVPKTHKVVIKVQKDSNKDETARRVRQVEDVLEKSGIRRDMFEIKEITFTKFAEYKYRSGDQVNVEQRFGTLAGFARMRKAQTDEMVAILSNHVAENAHAKSYDPTLKIKTEKVGEVLPKSANANLDADISVASIPKDSFQHCDKKFRNEDSERLNAVPIAIEELERRPFERVHIWGANSKPGIAQVRELGLFRPEAGKYIYISTKSDVSHQTNWQKGDSGAMVLSERHRRERDQRMHAIGLLMGESIEGDDTKYVVSPLQSGLEHLSDDHQATFALYSDDSSEGDELYV